MIHDEEYTNLEFLYKAEYTLFDECQVAPTCYVSFLNSEEEPVGLEGDMKYALIARSKPNSEEGIWMEKQMIDSEC